jgi:predicted nucleic acid-binding protein
MITSWSVLAEAAWLWRNNPNGLQRLLHLEKDGLIEIATMDPEALPWIARFLDRYRKQDAQLADATLVYLADVNKIDTVFTLDRRDFSVYRFARNRSFEILPE